MFHILTGVLAASAVILLIGRVRSQQLKVKWWGWILTALGVLYLVFWLEVIIGFLEEGAGRGALVMGTILGLGGVFWSFLLARLVYTNRKGGPRKRRT